MNLSNYNLIGMRKINSDPMNSLIPNDKFQLDLCHLFANSSITFVSQTPHEAARNIEPKRQADNRLAESKASQSPQKSSARSRSRLPPRCLIGPPANSIPIPAALYVHTRGDLFLSTSAIRGARFLYICVKGRRAAASAELQRDSLPNEIIFPCSPRRGSIASAAAFPRSRAPAAYIL